MRRLFYTDVNNTGSLGLFLLRVAMGAAFVFHGWPKIQHMQDWMGANATIPPALQAAAAIAEFGGGMALILGLFTRLAALGIAGVMVTALATVHLPAKHPFVSAGGPSCELPTVYLACAILFFLAGAGRFSMDALLFGVRTRRPAEPVKR